MISHRGQQKAGTPLRDDLELLERAQQDAFSQSNPEGAITLCVAENLLQWERIRDRLRRIAATHPWPEWIAGYAPLPGHPDFREAVASFVTRYIAGGTPVEADYFCASAGATAVIELTALCLANEGEWAAFPAPAYQAYTPDIAAKAGLRRYDITDYSHDFNGDYHPLTVAQLDAAHAELGDGLRLLVLTQPDNPTGAIYSEGQLREIADWCEKREIHLVVNEIYALSRFVLEAVAYSSALPLIERRRSPYLHWWYSFSKDFGVSGLRIGLLYSHNETLRTAYANYNAPHQVSTLNQWLFSELLHDHHWVSSFQQENRKLLSEAYRLVTGCLDELGIPYTPAQGSLFVWADFSGFFGEYERPDELWKRLFEQTGLLLTAPGGLAALRPGWLRIVYSCVSPAALEEAMHRLRRLA